MSDLYEVDAELARGLQSLLEFKEGAGSIEEVFSVSFTASLNPLINSIANSNSSNNSSAINNGYVELIENGSNILVSRSSRTQFVDYFVQYALHGSAANAVQQYLDGLTLLFSGPAIDMCSLQEVMLASFHFKRRPLLNSIQAFCYYMYVRYSCIHHKYVMFIRYIPFLAIVIVIK